MIVNHSYHKHMEDPKTYKACLKFMAKHLKELQKKWKFDAIAFRGGSGESVGYPLSFLTGIPLLHVKKGSSHGSDLIGMNKEIKTYIVIDDFICSGTTVGLIIDKIGEFKPYGYEKETLKCVGIFLYDSCKHSLGFTLRDGTNIPIDTINIEDFIHEQRSNKKSKSLKS